MTDATTTPATIEHSIGARGRFILRQPAGEVAIRGVEGETARVREIANRPLADTFEIVTAEGSLELRPVDRLGGLIGLWRGGTAPSLAVEVPHGASVSVDAASADVAATDLTGDKRIRTASGDVSLARLAGAVDVATVSGDIEIDGQVQLEVLGRTVSGDVSLRLPRVRRLDLGTTSGDAIVDAELTGEGPFEVRTISGDVTVVARGGLRIEAQTVTGDVEGDAIKTVERTRGRQVATIGRGGSTLAFRSVSGDLSVVAAGSLGRTPEDAPRPETPPTPVPPANPDPATPAPPANRDPATPAPPARPAGATDASSAETPTPGDASPDEARLRILRALERGEISVTEAGEQLAELEEVLR